MWPPGLMACFSSTRIRKNSFLVVPTSFMAPPRNCIWKFWWTVTEWRMWLFTMIVKVNRPICRVIRALCSLGRTSCIVRPFSAHVITGPGHPPRFFLQDSWWSISRKLSTRISQSRILVDFLSVGSPPGSFYRES